MYPYVSKLNDSLNYEKWCLCFVYVTWLLMFPDVDFPTVSQCATMYVCVLFAFEATLFVMIDVPSKKKYVAEP